MTRKALRVEPGVGVHGLFVIFGVSLSAFFPFRAIYLRSRGLSSSDIGVVIALMAVGGLVTSPLWGHFADTRIGRVRALQFGTTGAAVMALSLNRVSGLWDIAIVSCAIAAFGVATGPNIDAIALEHLGPERMSDYGHVRSWESLSYATGCIVFGVILQTFGARWAMPLFGIAGLAILLWTFTLERDRPTRLEEHGRLGAVGAVFREAPRFWGFLVAVLLLWTGFNAAWNFVGLKIESAGGGPLLIGIGTALGGFVEVPVMRYSSRLQRGWGLRRVYVLGCCIYATGFLLWGLISNPTIVSLLTTLEGLAFGLLFTTAIVIIGRLLPSTLYSTGASIMTMVGLGIGPILGAGIGGYVYQHSGAVVLYSGAAALALAAAVAAWIALSPPELSQPERERPAAA
jgi:MFS transporter, PPP family, 3-phenylpropionic acid transporter